MGFITAMMVDEAAVGMARRAFPSGTRGTEGQPEEAVGAHRKVESGLPDGGEGVPVKKLDRDKVLEAGEVERHRLGPVGEVVEYQDHILAHLPKIGENAPVTRIQDGHLATTEKSGRLPDCEHLTEGI